MRSSHERDARLELNDKLISGLRGYLQRYLGDCAVAEDLVQETLLRATRGLPGYAARATLKTWVFSIASRVAADYLRDPDRKRVVAMCEDEPCDVALPIDERLIDDEMNSCVREVVDSLPANYRSALLLHEFEGMTAAEVAEVLNCSIATAKIRIHRGRSRLREALGKSCNFYHDSVDSLRCDRKS